MTTEIPKVFYKEENDLNIEVKTFKSLLKTFDKIENHNPYKDHRIEFFIILVVTNGSYKHHVDFRSYDLEKGDALFIAKNQLHHFTYSLKKCEGYVIVFHNKFREKYHFLLDGIKFNRLFNYHIESPIIHQKEFGDDSFLDITKQLYKEYKHLNSFAKKEILKTLLQLLILKAERAKEQNNSEVSIKPYWVETFNLFKNKLELNYSKSRSSRNYASELNISYKFLNDVVKQLTGKTSKTFIDDFVITEIKRLLVSTSLSIKEISFKTGFEEPSNMVKFFKKNTQTTPNSFRNNL